MQRISVQKDDFDIGAEINAVRATSHDIGAIVSFTGTVRDLGGSLQKMVLEHYPGMTEKELEHIADQAEKRWPIKACRIIHRFGSLKPGDNIVLVITASAHREAAFQAADYVMDFLKSNAPFWKKEHTSNGQRWVAAHDKDINALKRW